jgi:hypothetical protein
MREVGCVIKWRCFAFFGCPRVEETDGMVGGSGMGCSSQRVTMLLAGGDRVVAGSCPDVG